MTSIPKLTEEEKNFTRFFLLNFKVSPHIVRRFFDEKFPPSNLAQDINSNVRDIINLNKTKRINAAQLEILRGVPGTIWSPYRPPMPLWTKGNYVEYYCNVMFFFFVFVYFQILSQTDDNEKHLLFLLYHDKIQSVLIGQNH